MSMQDALKASMTLDSAPAQTIEPPAPPAAAPEPPADTTPAPAPEPTPPPATPFDPVAWLKEQLGEDIDSVDTLKSKLHAPPPEPTVQAPTFENEDSKKIYEALLSGKESEVADYLSKKQFVLGLKEKTPEQIVKEGLKAKFGLTDAQAERRFQKEYSVDEFAEDADKEIEQKIVAKRIEEEADRYKEFFSKYEQDIKLPEIAPPPVPASTVDYTSTEAKNAMAFASQLNTPIADLANIPFEVSDSNLKFKGQVAIPKTEVESYKSQFNGQEDKFIETRWFDKNGDFKTDLFARDMYCILNSDKIVAAAATQAAAQARLEFLKENRNYQPANSGSVVKGDFLPSDEAQRTEWYRQHYM